MLYAPRTPTLGQRSNPGRQPEGAMVPYDVLQTQTTPTPQETQQLPGTITPYSAQPSQYSAHPSQHSAHPSQYSAQQSQSPNFTATQQQQNQKQTFNLSQLQAGIQQQGPATLQPQGYNTSQPHIYNAPQQSLGYNMGQPQLYNTPQHSGHIALSMTPQIYNTPRTTGNVQTSPDGYTKDLDTKEGGHMLNMLKAYVQGSYMLNSHQTFVHQPGPEFALVNMIRESTLNSQQFHNKKDKDPWNTELSRCNISR
jgi:hypothetical protein